MSLLPAPLEPVRPAFLGRVTPATRLLVGFVWLAAAIVTVDPVVPARLIAAAIVALVFLSGLPLRRVPTRLLPIWFGIASLTVFTILLNSANADPSLPEAARIGPFRITYEAIWSGVSIALRVIAIALISLLVFATSDQTGLADSLVQQWRVPDRFAYGTLAAVRLVPFVATDWTTIGAARRLRGLGGRGVAGRIGEWPERLLVLLVSAIRRAERIALAMDARGFDSGVRRSHFREMRVGWRDWVTIAAGVAVAAAALLLWR